MNNRKIVSLNVKLTLAIGLSFVLSIGAVLLAGLIGNEIINSKFLSEAAVQRNMNEVYEDFENYIASHDVAGYDTKAIKSWLSEREDTYLYIYDNNQVYFNGGWNLTENGSLTDEYVNDSAEESMDSVSLVEEDTPRIDEETFDEDSRNRIIQFADDKYYVYIDTYKEQSAYIALNVSRYVIAFLIFFGVFLTYNRRVLQRVAQITEKTKQISDGALNVEIKDRSNDEIRVLADSVNAMKNSIIQRQENERAAWNANAELITSMSHDIKTPLTSIIGYLDILETKTDLSEEERQRYLQACHDKAVQLSDMSNKMFQYFLVFGNEHKPEAIETYDAGILMEQILSEHCAELINNGFDIKYDFGTIEGQLKIDLPAMLRIFDNVFSNVMKYAEKQIPVNVATWSDEEGDLLVKITNAISKESRKIESTKIGLRTCEKLCEGLNGNFKYSMDEDTFVVDISLPLYLK